MNDRVVIEYRFRAYTPPKDLEAFSVDGCRITYADVPLATDSDNLFDIRADLENLDFRMHGAHQTKPRHAGRYNPTWREVWVPAN